MLWWDEHDEGWIERGDVRPRNRIALAQLIVGVLIATAIIVYLAS